MTAADDPKPSDEPSRPDDAPAPTEATPEGSPSEVDTPATPPDEPQEEPPAASSAPSAQDSEPSRATGPTLAMLLGGGLALLFLGLLVGRLSAPGDLPEPKPAGAGSEQAAPSMWTCSMHPKIQSPEPGSCPICGMDLIPVSVGGGGGPRTLELSPMAAELAEIETAPVERRDVAHEIRLVGKVDFDETRLSYITAWIPGRLDRLYVDYTGTLVRKGDHLVDLYSPQLLNAQEELFQAIDTQRKLKDSGSAFLQESATRSIDSSREKLRLWGLAPDQIQAIEATGQVADHVTVRAPTGGIVVHKNKNVGDYVKTGERVYTIADLSQVWVKLDAYESDLSWIRYGQSVSFETEAYPGRHFEGRVVLVDPVLAETTRTVKLRLNVANADGKLKPGMFVRAVVHTQLTAAGGAMDPALGGKWICPMHGEVIKDEQGACDLCGMPLVTAESLHSVAGALEELPLVVPAAAVLWTGTRSVVYVREPGDAPRFTGRVVELGPRSGDYYVIERGVKEGERVVTQGAFKIDSALQIQARPSMMLPDPPAPTRLPASAQALAALEPTYAAYAVLHRALAGDDLPAAQTAAGNLIAASRAVDLELFSERESKQLWVALAARAREASERLAQAASIADARTEFLAVSGQILTLAQRLGHGGSSPRYEVFCSMAFDSAGGSWLQADKQIANPYYGSSMLRCGEVRETFAPGLATEPGPTTRPAQEGSAPEPVDQATEALRKQLTTVWTPYLAVQQALADDDPQTAQAHAKHLTHALGQVTPDPAAQAEWEPLRASLAAAGEALAAREALAEQRVVFEDLSSALSAVFARFGHEPGHTVRRFRCPMAFDNRGADWLQEDERTLNPYFGASMLRCGNQVAELPAGGAR